MNSQAVKNKQEELYKKLDEIDNAIATFSRKKVFVKVDSQKYKVECKFKI